MPVPLKPDIEPSKYYQSNTYKLSTADELFLQEEIKNLMPNNFWRNAPNKRHNKRVEVLSDNISCVANINHLGSPSKHLSELTQSLWITVQGLNIDLTA